MSLLGKNTPHEDHGEPWLVSYADMMTLLFGFFVILFSMSQEDEKKFNDVGKQLAEAFGGEKKAEHKAEVGMMMEGRHLRALQLLVAMLNLGDSVDQAVERIEKKASESQSLEAARDLIMDNMKSRDTLAALQASAVSKEDRVEIALPDNMLFESGTAVLTPGAKDGLKKVAAVLAKVNDLVGLEVTGHTDAAPPSPQALYPSNWALSSARAGAVAEELVRNGVNPKGLVTRGLASQEPLFPETRPDNTPIPENRAKNRRVRIVVRKARSGEDS